jgi:Family of unknown function (DUF5681)
MTEHHPSAERDGRGRFVPGCSGNPAGKKPGTRNRAARLKELLRDGDAEAAGRAIIARAVGGDTVAGRFLFERLDPKPRGRPIALARTAGTLAERFAVLFAAVAGGDITPDEALALGRLLDLERKAIGAAAGAPDAVSASSPEPTAAQREAAALAELAAIFGAAPVAASGPPEPAERLHSTCIAAPSRSDEDAGAAAHDPLPMRHGRPPRRPSTPSSRYAATAAGIIDRPERRGWPARGPAPTGGEDRAPGARSSPPSPTMPISPLTSPLTL